MVGENFGQKSSYERILNVRTAAEFEFLIVNYEWNLIPLIYNRILIGMEYNRKL